MGVTEFSKRIVSIRKELRLSQAALAALVGVTTGAVQSWEHGRRFPQSIELLETLAKCLGVTAGWLVDGGETLNTPLLPLDILEAARDPRIQQIIRASVKALAD